MIRASLFEELKELRLMGPLFEYDFLFHIQTSSNCSTVIRRQHINAQAHKYLNNTCKDVNPGRQVFPCIYSESRKGKLNDMYEGDFSVYLSDIQHNS